MADEKKVLEFSLVLAEIPVRLTNADGKTKDYFIRELDGRERDSYLTTMGDKVKHNSEGKFLGLKNYDGLNSSLLCRTLFLTETKKNVGVAELQKMPAKVLAELFSISQDMSGLGEEADEEAKNG